MLGNVNRTWKVAYPELHSQIFNWNMNLAEIVKHLKRKVFFI